MTLGPSRAAVVALIVGLAASVAAAFASDHTSSPEKAVEHSAAPVEPLKLPRTGAQPLEDVRELTYLQDRIGEGDGVAHGNQSQTAEAIAQRLRSYPLDVWTDARNRLALVKFTLSGGDPALLRAVAGKQLFAEAELPLARGALAYAEGFRQNALQDLEKVNVLQLGPSLAGHVALVQSILTADGDPAGAAQTAKLARSLSPGTLVEEAALRLAVEIDIQLSDRQRFETDASRYLRRFPSSRFVTQILAQLGSFAAFNDYPARPPQRAWLLTATANLDPVRRVEMFIVMAEHALRYGKLGTAEFAATQAGLAGGDRARVLAYQAASTVIGADPEKGLQLLTAAEAFSPDGPTADLIAMARIVGDFIRAPAEPASTVPESKNDVTKSPSAAIANVAIIAADRLLEETQQ